MGAAFAGCIFPPAPTPAGGVELKMSAYTLWYKNIYEGMLAFCTHTSIRYTIRIVPRNRPSRGQPLVSKHGLYQMWIAWMESMGGEAPGEFIIWKLLSTPSTVKLLS